MELLGGEQGKTLLQIEPHLMAKKANGTSTCPIFLLYAGLKYIVQQIKVLLHIYYFFSRCKSRLFSPIIKKENWGDID
jgi:hypothetical protein